ncbi:MAG: SDR family oxidoreductase [Gammaproteobacteria bacterium]|nr:SDR family oxidoreductase [Gammaproteobacteria bacterium]
MKTILITGTTSGIGKVTALELARQGHEVVMANRNRARTEQLAREIIEQTGNDKVSQLDLDLASLASVRACADEFLRTHGKLDILLNNAGLMSTEEVITEDGFELQFAVNNLAPFLLTLQLMPALEAAVPSQVIFVTSMMHKFGKLDFDSFRGWKKYSGGASYNQSKLAMMLNASELAERVRGKRIAVNTLHPGAVNTGILDNYSTFAQFFLRRLFIVPEKGAQTSLYLAAQDARTMPTGKYFVNSKVAKAGKHVGNRKLQEQLWELCCEYCGVVPVI